VLSGCEGGNDRIAYWQMAGLTDNVCTVGMATPMRDKFVMNNAAPPRTRRSRLSLPLFGPGRAYLYRLRRMLERASRPLVRAPVRPRQRYRRWHRGPLQFVRDASQELLDYVPLYMGSARRLVVSYLLIAEPCSLRAHDQR
jgi:hypothetical protein